MMPAERWDALPERAREMLRADHFVHTNSPQVMAEMVRMTVKLAEA